MKPSFTLRISIPVLVLIFCFFAIAVLGTAFSPSINVFITDDNAHEPFTHEKQKTTPGAFPAPSIVMPSNDDPCINSTHPPLDLTGIGEHAGTTCGAQGPGDLDENGDPLDYESKQCISLNSENAVWYQYTPDSNDEGYDITLTGEVIGEVYWGAPDQGCNGGFSDAVVAKCSPTENGILRVRNCPPQAGDILHIKVSSSREGCGAFTLSMSPEACNADSEDECIDAISIGSTTTSPCSVTPYLINVQGCLTYACPETITDECIFGDNPTVWFKVKIDEDAAQLVVQISNYDWDPVYAVFKGNCDSLEIVGTSSLDYSTICGGSETPSPGTHSVGVDYDDTDTYWIAVSGNNIQSNDIIEFPITVFSTDGCTSCIGDFSCGEQIAEWSIEERSSDRALDDPEFCPGEEVRVCVEFFYDATTTGVDWLHGITPVFGNGWDDEASNIYGSTGPTNAHNSTDEGDPIWFAADSTCVMATEDFPYLAAYEDDGHIKLCHILCGNCPTGLDSTLKAGDPLPGGWYFLSPACDGSLDCPSSVYGITSTTADINLCWDMVVRSDLSENCTSEERDLNISIMTTSDGVTGCWDDPVAECLLDPMQIGPDWSISCTDYPEIIAADDTLCYGEYPEIQFATGDGSILDIAVQVIDNPQVDGEGSDEGGAIAQYPDFTTFTEGDGLIKDTLINTTDTTQSVIYRLRPMEYNDECGAQWDTVTVTLGSQSALTMLDTVFKITCDAVNDTLSINDTYSNYQWSDSSGTIDGADSSFYVASSPGTYHVSFDDSLGCIGGGTFVINMVESIELMIPPAITACNENVGLGNTVIDFTSLVTGISGNWEQLDTIGSGDFDFSDLTNVSFEGVTAGSYTFQFTTDMSLEPCEEVSATMIVMVENCECPSTALMDIARHCNAGDIIDLNTAKVTTEDGSWSVVSGPEGQDLSMIISDTIFNTSGITPGTYTLRYTLSPDPPSPCPAYAEIELMIEEAPYAEKITDAEVCNNDMSEDPTTVDLDDLINATAGGNWTTSGSGMLDANNVFNGTGLIVGDSYTFTYTTPETETCEAVSVDVAISIINCECPDDIECGVHPDYNALMTLYNSTGGENWINNSGWSYGATGINCNPCNAWYGVHCDESCRVICIDLDGDDNCEHDEDAGGNNLTGTIPAEIQDLSMLEDLNLHSNNLYGSIPQRLYDMEQLKKLRLSDNILTGELTIFINDLENLEYLSVSNNNLEGSVPGSLGSITGLRILHLDHNDFSSALPEGLSVLDSITSLRLNNNNLSGCFPASYRALCEVDEIDFTGNPMLPWQGDFDRFCLTDGSSSAQEGSACFINNMEGEIDENCQCLPLSATLEIISDRLVIYPNPTDDKIYIKDINEAHYEIKDLQGREIMTGLYRSANGINMTKYPTGLYLVLVYTDQGIHLGKVMRK